MKKLMFTIAAMILTCGVFAQTDPATKNANTDQITQKQHRHPNGYMMKDGRMMLVKDGNLTLIQKDITLSDGTVIMADGNYMRKGKSKVMLKDGEHIAMDGSIAPMNNSKSK